MSSSSSGVDKTIVELLYNRLQNQKLEREKWDVRYSEPAYWKQHSDYFPIDRPEFDSTSGLSRELTRELSQLQSVLKL